MTRLIFLKTDFTSRFVVGQNLGKSKKKSNFLKKGWKPKKLKYLIFGVETGNFLPEWVAWRQRNTLGLIKFKLMPSRLNNRNYCILAKMTHRAVCADDVTHSDFYVFYFRFLRNACSLNEISSTRTCLIFRILWP